MDGRTIDFDGNGSRFQGYLSGEGTGRPGVVVIQEWWGLVGHVKDVCDRFAGEGFVALAPDFYGGKTTSEPSEAGSLMMALNIDEAGKVIRGAVSQLLEEGASSVGVVGFCMGGQLSLYAASIDDRIGAAVDFYGIHPQVKPDFAGMKAPVLGLFAERDDYTNAEAVAALGAELTATGVEHEFVTYPGTDHAFFNDERPEVYDAEAAADAWGRTLRFLRERLG